MRKEFFTKLYLIILIISSLVLFTNCGTTPLLSSVVCEYTEVICDYSDVICQQVPESCWYINLACINLAILCDSQATQQQKAVALDVLKLNNQLLKKELEVKK